MASFFRPARATLLALLATLPLLTAHAKDVTVTSPDRQLTVTLSDGANLKLAARHQASPAITLENLQLKMQGMNPLGANAKLKGSKVVAVNTELKPSFYKRDRVKQHYNELQASFGNYSLLVRVYNEGFAYRWQTFVNQPVIIEDENVVYRFTEVQKSWLPEAQLVQGPSAFKTSFENLYDTLAFDTLANPAKAVYGPLLFQLKNGLRLWLSEADLRDYPGMWWQVAEKGKALSATFAPYPKQILQANPDKPVYEMGRITGRENYIAKTNGRRDYPWRVIAVGTTDVALADHDLVCKLATPNQLGDVSWVKPGLVSWEWWNNRNVTGVDFEVNYNTPTYKYFADFAGSNGLPYIILDEGWSKLFDPMAIRPDLDLPELIRHAAGKNVGIILWMHFLPLSQNMEPIMKRYAEMGVKGFKIDFMDRDDQAVVRFYEDCLALAAKYKLMIDYHGAFKPTGLNFTYPNEVSREGVRGLENYKWSPVTSGALDYEVTIPFTRMQAGHMDFTPGAMVNYSSKNFKPIFKQPGSCGTRTRQLAMFVCYESPLQMLSDAPRFYEREKPSLDFIKTCPTTWHETQVLAAQPGRHVAYARRNGKTWYVGALTGDKASELSVTLPFVTKPVKAVVYRDGANAAHIAEDYKREEVELKPGQPLTIKMAPGGGFVLRVEL